MRGDDASRTTVPVLPSETLALLLASSVSLFDTVLAWGSTMVKTTMKKTESVVDLATEGERMTTIKERYRPATALAETPAPQRVGVDLRSSS